jgi:uncharacterized protein YjbI with pentapeptide repeats
LVSLFAEEFESELEKQEKKHPDYLDFSGFSFPISWRFTTNFRKAYFKNTVFQGDVSFKHENKAGNIIFHSEVDFSQMKIEGDATFDRVVFSEYVEAFDISFENVASFRNAKFDSGVDFAYSSFGGPTYFNSSIFSSFAIFWHTMWKERVEFDFAEFKSAHFPVFSDAIFENEISMNNIRSLTPPDFTDAEFKKEVTG